MSRLKVALLGSPEISIDGRRLINRNDKTVALIAFLALQGPTQQRDILITNFWNGSPISKGRAALRTALWRLKNAGLSPWLEIERETITVRRNHNLWIDVEEFRENLERSKRHHHDLVCACPNCSPLLNRAVELYRGDFMSSYSPANAVGFDEWRVQLGEVLRNDYLSTLEQLARSYHTAGQNDQAIKTARRWLEAEPLKEEAHNLIIHCFSSNHQPDKAIAHYRSYKRLLSRKLKVLPSEEITTIYQHVLNERVVPSQITEQIKHPAMLLLDIEHAQDLWTRNASLMNQVLIRLSTLVKEGLRRYGGRIIQQSGESFAIYFDHGQPIQYTVALQKRVAEAKWSTGEQLLLRAIITTISTSQSNDSEYASTLSVCRQLLEAASANQILFTEQAASDVELPASSRLHNLGSYRIPGQTSPLQVYELIHKNRQSTDHLRLDKLTQLPVNLPVQSTQFIGREAELAQIFQLLSNPDGRLITLVGPGGVGKTRLGVQVISQLQIMPADGVHYVPLAAHRNPNTLYEPIADVLNLSFNNPGDQTAQLIEHIRHKQMVFLLDNFEHLLPGTPFLIELLEQVPGLRLMLTSRERLNSSLETVCEVRGLPYPVDPADPQFEQYSGINLFVQTARRVSPAFSLCPEDKPAILQICKLVDGLPLGIELSSSWVRAFSCQEIADSIQINLDFAQTTSPDVPTRHRSLRAAFDHSWQLLSEEDRRTISKLSIYRNGFSQQAADQLANANSTMLASYVDKNLLARQPNARYMMPETLRTYALEYLKADPQEYESLLDAHSEYFLNYLLSLYVVFTGKSGASAIKEFWLDADNTLDALYRAIEQRNWPLVSESIDPLMSAYELQGRIREGNDHAIAIMKRITDLIGMRQPDIYYSLLGWAGNFSFRLGLSQEAFEKMNTSLVYTQSQGDMFHSARTLLFLADAHRRHGDQNTALQEITQCLELLEPQIASGNTVLSGAYAYALTILGMIQHKLDQFEAVWQTLFRCNAVLEKSDRYYFRIRSLDLQARIAVSEGRTKESIDLRLEAIAIAEEFNDRRNIAILLNNLGDSMEHMGDRQSTIAYIAKANQISSEMGDRQLLALTNNNLGFFALQDKNLSDAIAYYERSLTMYRLIHNTLGTFMTLRDTSRAYLLTHDLTSARSLIVEALQLGAELGDPDLVMQLLTVIAHLLAQTGQPERAMQLCSIAIARSSTDSYIRNEAEKLLTEIAPQFPEFATTQSPVNPALPTFASLLAEI